MSEAAEGLEQWKACVVERKVIDVSPAAISLAMLMMPAKLLPSSTEEQRA